MAQGKFISYLRVSTDKQGLSGLGIEAQCEAVTSYLGVKRRPDLTPRRHEEVTPLLFCWN